MSISGFPEFLPAEQIFFTKHINLLQQLFQSYGFLPFDTPVVERLSTLLSKGADHEIYGLYRLGEEEASKDLGLRFDLTVPFARYVAEHAGCLIFPYARYHIAPVWRGERPQAGRYRQFYQCDIDVIGDGVLDIAYDAQILFLIHHGLEQLGIQNTTLKINHRKVLLGILFFLNIEEKAFTDVIRILDKVEKLPLKTWQEEMASAGCSAAAVSFFTELYQGAPLPMIDHPLFQEGMQEIKDIVHLSGFFGLPADRAVFSPFLARGLAYYSGILYEVTWQDAPELGTICGGGRYAALAEHFTTRTLPGVGVSFGISRLLPRLFQRQTCQPLTIAPVLVTVQDPDCLPAYIDLSLKLRKAGINTELYLAKKSLSAQMKYADKRGFSYAILANAQELLSGLVTVRFLKTGEQQHIASEALPSVLSSLTSAL